MNGHTAFALFSLAVAIAILIYVVRTGRKTRAIYGEIERNRALPKKNRTLSSHEGKMAVQKLANYEQMRKQWNADFKQSCKSHGLILLVTTLVFAVMVKFMLGAVNQQVMAGAILAWMAQLSIPMLYLLLLPIGVILLIPVIFAAIGPRPHPKDVEFNQALRRAYGMSDEVSNSKDI